MFRNRDPARWLLSEKTSLVLLIQLHAVCNLNRFNEHVVTSRGLCDQT